jgi:hypothetical protein
MAQRRQDLTFGPPPARANQKTFAATRIGVMRTDPQFPLSADPRSSTLATFN